MGIASPDNCLDIADSEVRAVRALREDLMAVLFPYGGYPPSELLQSRVRHKIQSLVNGMEAELEGSGERGRCWEMLSRSSLLREAALIDFALARIAEDDLRKNLTFASELSPLTQLPVRLFDHHNVRIAQFAKTLLNAEYVTANDQLLFCRLEPELLHLLCWRIVAALQEIEGGENHGRVVRAQTLLSAHDFNRNPSAVAQKLVFFLGPEFRDTLLDPTRAGMHLFVATLAQTFGVHSDLILQWAGAPTNIPLMVLLRAAQVPPTQLRAILLALRPKASEYDRSVDFSDVHKIDPVEARAYIAAWSKEAAG